MPASFALSRIGQIALGAQDLERAIRFYRDALGLPLLFRAPPGMAFFDCGGVRLLLGGPEAGAHPGTGGVLYYFVDDIRAAAAALQARGVAFDREPTRIATLADREVWLAEFKDSEGNPAALMSEPPLPPAARP